MGLEEGNPLFELSFYRSGPSNPYGTSGATDQPAGFSSSPGRARLVADDHQDVDAGVAAACGLWGGALHVPVFLIARYQVSLARLISILDFLKDNLEDDDKKVPVQIHGYIGLTLEVGKKLPFAAASASIPPTDHSLRAHRNHRRISRVGPAHRG